MAQRVSPPWQRRPTRKLRRSQLGYLGIGVRRVLGGGNAGGGAGVATARFDFSTGSVVDISGNGIVPTFTRATTKTQTDWEGRPSTAGSGEVVTEGLRRVRNLLAGSSEVFAGAYTLASATSVAGATDPLGGTGAYTITATGASGFIIQQPTCAIGDVRINSIWIRRRTGFGTIGLIGPDGSDANITATISTNWQRMSMTQVAASTNGYWGVRIVTSGDAVDIWRGQCENALGSSNQNPSEYVSVGVLSTPFHGAKTDGTKYFPYLNGNTVASNVVTEATGAAIPPIKGLGIGWLPGLSGSYFSTPESVAASVLGDIDIKVNVALVDWTPAAASTLIGKYVGGNASYLFQVINPNGVLRLYTTADGSTLRTATSSVAVGFTDGTAHWVRATRVAATGDVKFYTSDDGTTWTQLGTTQSTTAGAIWDNAIDVQIGAFAAVNDPLAANSIRRATISGAIDGAPAVDFQSKDWTTGGTFVSSTTGETWTLNGGAKVFRWANGYYPEVLGQNVAIQSENFGTTWALTGTGTRSAAAKMCGNIKLDLLGDTDAGVASMWAEPVTFTGDGVKAISIVFSQGSATASTIEIRDTTAPASRLFATITWVNGIPSINLSGVGTLIGVFPKVNGCWRLEALTSAVTAANTHHIRVYPACDAVGTVTLTGTIYAGGVQAENNAERVSSYIPTTTGAVTRNKDDMAVTTLGAWFNPLAGTIVAKVFSKATNGAAMIGAFSDGTANEIILLGESAGALGNLYVGDGGVSQVNNSAGAMTRSGANAIATAYAVNDFPLIVNGVVTATDSAGTLPTPTRLEIGQDGQGGAQQFNALISSFDYYPSRLSNATQQVLAAKP